MIRVDFDVPSYLRLPKGLCIVSPRLAHLLPEHAEDSGNEGLEPVVINRLFNAARRQEVAVAHDVQPEEDIKAEYIPRESVEDVDHALGADDLTVDQSDIQGAEISFQGVEGKSVVGSYAGSGYAHYRFLKSNGKSFYLRIGKHLIWGAELAQQLRKSGAKKGDQIEVTFLGKTPVTVLKTVKVDGEAKEEWVDTHRNSWRVRVV